MIRTIRHRGLRQLYDEDSPRGVQADHVARLRHILSNLDVATRPIDMDLPGYRLHQLRGERSGAWSVRVSGNWRVTFRFDDKDVTDVDLENYH